MSLRLPEQHPGRSERPGLPFCCQSPKAQLGTCYQPPFPRVLHGVGGAWAGVALGSSRPTVGPVLIQFVPISGTF